jgi:hypothetical protein
MRQWRDWLRRIHPVAHAEVVDEVERVLRRVLRREPRIHDLRIEPLDRPPGFALQ